MISLPWGLELSFSGRDSPRKFAKLISEFYFLNPARWR
jgi:hypothetical protein